MRYFITGATGFIGGHISRMLREAGHEVVALVRNPAKAADLQAMGVILAEGDITDKESMRQPMAMADGVFHIAAWYKVGVKDGTPDAKRAYSINVEGTRNVLEVAQELNIPRIVYTSTLAVNSDTGGQMVDESYRYDGEHLTVYDRTKAQAHYEVALPMIEAGLPLVIVQPGVVYGPGDHSAVRDALRDYLQGKLPMTPQQTAYAWAHVEDTARGHILAMEKGKIGENYFISGPVHTFIEAIAIAEEITGVPAPKMHPAPGMMKALAGVMGTLEKVLPIPADYGYESLRTIAGVTYIGSNEKARRELGYDPRPLREGLRETLLHEMQDLGMETP